MGTNEEMNVPNFILQRPLLFLHILIFSLLASGCAPQPFRVHPELHERVKNVGSIGIVPLDIKIYEVSNTGVVEFRDDWSAVASENVKNALLEEFRRRKQTLELLLIDGETAEEMEQVRTLYSTVNKSIRLHTYGPQLFPEKRVDFDYSLGPVEGILQNFGVDLLLLVYGVDRVSKVDRRTWLSVALADSSGSILWYSVKGSRGVHDLRDPQSSAALVKDLLSTFPEIGG